MLDLSQIATQLQTLIPDLKDASRRREESLPRLRQALQGDPLPWEDLQARLKDRVALLDYPRPAELIADPSVLHPLPPIPDAYTVLAADGSQVDLDRHAPASCYVVNIGQVRITYGPGAAASLTSTALLRSGPDADEEETDEESRANRERIRVDLSRTVHELRGLRDLSDSSDPSMPTLALLDGSLAFWGARLAGDAGKAYIGRYQRQLDAFQVAAAGRPLTLASYISRPGGREVTRAVRAAFCYKERSRCQDECWNTINPEKPCAIADPVLDGELWSHLKPGERSAIFLIHPSVPPENLHFFYVNAGPEIGRVEIPEWIAADPNLVDLVHAVVYDQCRRGSGYPLVLMEAHEQAVVSEADRKEFWELVRLALAGEHLSEGGSAKALSKRAPWA